MIVTVRLSWRDALWQAKVAGQRMALAHGPPDLVIGVRRGGVAIAIALAAGAGSQRLVYVTRRMSTRPAAWRSAAALGRTIVPSRLRQLGRQWLYRPLMRALMAFRAIEPMPGPFIDELAELHALLGTIGTATVVVADDAIDTGATMQRIVAMVERMAPQATVIPFALTSTLGERIHPRQVHIFEDVVEYEEGDIGALSADAALAMMESSPAVSVERDR